MLSVGEGMIRALVGSLGNDPKGSDVNPILGFACC